MVSQTSVSISMDRDLKTAFNDFCSDMGISMTTAFNLFARKTVSEYRIPFDVGDSLPNAETLEAIDPSLGKTYTDVDEMMRELLA